MTATRPSSNTMAIVLLARAPGARLLVVRRRTRLICFLQSCSPAVQSMGTAWEWDGEGQAVRALVLCGCDFCMSPVARPLEVHSLDSSRAHIRCICDVFGACVFGACILPNGCVLGSEHGYLGKITVGSLLCGPVLASQSQQAMRLSSWHYQ